MGCFAYSKRLVPLTFFEEDPITVTLTIGDKADKAIVDSAAMIEQADRSGMDGRADAYHKALALLITDEKAEAILARGEGDSFAALEVWNYVVQSYRAAKTKNLTAPATR